MLENLRNYFMYAPIAQNEQVTIDVSNLTIQDWQFHYNGLLNIMKDGVETPQVQKSMITLTFESPIVSHMRISIPDMYLNVILWHPLVALGVQLQPYHVLIKDTITADDIKDYVDKFIIMPNRLKIDNKKLNNVIADMLCMFVDVDNFSYYLLNTLNLEDDIDLMEASPEFKQLIHCDLSNVPIENVKDAGMDIVHRAIDIIMESKKIMGYEHCLRNPFAAKEGINIRQYKENHYNIGTKPDGQGSIYHEIINHSYINGGLNNPVYQLIDSGSSRVAQIISKKNVGESGGFSRILGLNNINSFLYPDPDYDCGTKNFMYILIENKDVLKRLIDRYYRLVPNGEEYIIDEKSQFLIGKYIYLRSPITCASMAQGLGVCYHCYGLLAHTNRDINIGRIATELISSQYIQKRLSAKHLLETLIDVIRWNGNFKQYFGVDTNAIKLMEATSKALEGFSIVINPEDIQLENDDEFFQHNFYSNDSHSLDDDGPFYNEFLTSFNVLTPTGEMIPIGSEADQDTTEAKMYLASDLVSVIREVVSKNKDASNEEDDEESIVIPFSMLEDKTLFYIKVQNNDIGKNLDIFIDLVNKKEVTKSFNKDQLLEKLLAIVKKGGIHCMSIHLEVILSNQIVSAYDRLKKPNWLNPNEEYEILTLNEALTDNPSIAITLLYQKLAKTLYSPMSFRKIAPSIFDPFFLRQPKKFLNADHEIWDESNQSTIQPGECPVMFMKEHDGPRPKDVKSLLEKIRNQEKTELD